MTDQKRYLSWREVEELAARLARMIHATGKDYDVLLGIARGGMFPALLLAQVLEHGMTLTCHLRRYEPGATDSDAMPRIVAFPPIDLLHRKRVLVVDEVWDRGDSLIRVRQEVETAEPNVVDTAVLHFKPVRNRYGIARPTFCVEQTEDWIVYPWEAFVDAYAEPEVAS